MIDEIQKRADKEEDKYRKRYHLNQIEVLARQIRDARLFERTHIASWENLYATDFIDIARVYLESGDVETAYSSLKKIPEGDNDRAYERDKLLEEIYCIQGNSENLIELLFQNFRLSHSTDTLQALLDVIGHDKRDDVVNDEVRKILKSDRLSESDAEFMIAVGKIDEAETCLLKRIDGLVIHNYSRTFSIARGMESENRLLVASLVCRRLLGETLKDSMNYSTGVQCLEKLDELSMAITDWKNFDSHEAFKKKIVEAHGHKRSFWSKYRGRK